MRYYIARIALYLAFLTVSAYATTDILRLLKGSTLSINERHCRCPHCGRQIPLWRQIPILSYLVSRGRCFSCRTRIPAGEFCLELGLFLAFHFIFLMFGPTALAFALFVCIYECVKALLILLCGARRDRFAHQLLLSLRNNLFLFAMLGFILFICSLAAVP